MSQDNMVAIIGGGAAGIGAARLLARAGRACLIIEARDRLGGRAWTHDLSGMPVDLGCGWLHSAERNPWRMIAEEANVTVDRTPAAWRRQYRELGITHAEQAELGTAFAAFDDRLRQAPPASDRAGDAVDPGDPHRPWLEALSGYINGVGLDDLSVADYLAYDDAASDYNWRLPEGYGALVAGSAPAGVQQLLSTPVSAVDLTANGVRIETDAGPITASAAIVTCPPPVLTSETIRFPREVTPWLEAAADLPLGLADKLFLTLNAPEWVPPDQHLLGAAHRAETGSYTLRPFGRPLVEAFFGGAGAQRFEAATPAEIVAFAIDELVALLGSRWRNALRPAVQSAWGRDPFARGSYSHARPGRADARARLRRPVNERLVFAGEACSATDFSTAHGALESGELAARFILSPSTLA